MLRFCENTFFGKRTLRPRVDKGDKGYTGHVNYIQNPGSHGAHYNKHIVFTI